MSHESINMELMIRNSGQTGRMPALPSGKLPWILAHPNPSRLLYHIYGEKHGLTIRTSERGVFISTIHGNLHGLKPNQIRRLEKLYQRRIPPRDIITQEFARQLSEASHEIHRQVGVLVNRNGYVEHVVVGNARSIVGS